MCALVAGTSCARPNPAFDQADASTSVETATGGDGGPGGSLDSTVGADASAGATTQNPGPNPTSDSGIDTGASDSLDPSTSGATDTTDGTDTMDAQCPLWSGPCALFAQDACAKGMKCAPIEVNGVWSGECVPIEGDPGVEGDACSLGCGLHGGADDCGNGLTCWFDVCTAMCDLPVQQCDGPGQACVEPGFGAQGFGLCMPECNPLLQDCGNLQACVPEPAGGFVCVPDASGGAGEQGDGCNFTNDCTAGFVCAEGPDVGECLELNCCTALCDETDPLSCPPGSSCIGFLIKNPLFPDVGVCLAL